MYVSFINKTLSVVPPPRTEISINAQRYVSDGIVTLFCTVTLPASVNNDESVTVVWTGPIASGQLRNSSKVTLSNINTIASGVFQSSLTIASYDPASDNGIYGCNATIVPSSSLITYNSAMDTQNVTVSRK